MERRQVTVIIGILVTVVAVLFAFYWLLFRPGMATLYEDIREQDAAEIVALLDQQGIDYRLEDSGHQIMVPEDEVGRARVLVAGSGIAMGGVVGFELFNETDMGLTEFAQKVNYQRALQGELARTIMTMDGIGFARVHLSLPERSLFQTNQPGPKAAVTLQTERGTRLGAARVEGIQRLISSAVPSLNIVDVSILDNRGQVLSARPAGNDAGELDERGALEEYFRARIASVAEALIPGVPLRVRVRAVDTISTATPPRGGEAADVQNQRNFRLHVFLRTERSIAVEDREFLQDAIVEAAGLRDARGDVLAFETGLLDEVRDMTASSAAPALPESPPLTIPANGGAPAVDPFGVDLLWNMWLWLALAAMALLVLALRRRGALSRQEQASFAELLRERLVQAEGGEDGR